jgi:hypothetical protein
LPWLIQQRAWVNDRYARLQTLPFFRGVSTRDLWGELERGGDGLVAPCLPSVAMDRFARMVRDPQRAFRIMADGVLPWLEGLRAGWHTLLPGTERAFANALILGCFYYALVFVIERACGTRTANYRTRGFAHDVAYYFYVKSGLQRYVIPVTLFAALQEPLASFGPGLLDGLAYPCGSSCGL